MTRNDGGPSHRHRLGRLVGGRLGAALGIDLDMVHTAVGR